MLKKIKILSKALEWAVFVVLLGILGLVVSPYLPFKNVPKSFVVASGSMQPAIRAGSVAFVKPVSPSDVKKGDIIAFTSPSNPKDTILHRVDSIKTTDPLTFSTKGDANNAPDAWDVMDVQVKGVYFGSIPYLGNIAAFVRQPLGFSLLIILPAVLFIISQILNIKKSISEEIEKGVTKKLKEKSKEKSVVNKIIIFLLLIQALVAFGFRQTILALYTDKATVTGISVSTGTWDTDPDPQQSLSTSSALQSEESETTPAPTDTPTATPEATPTDVAFPAPTEEPTATPEVTPTPTDSPTDAPTSTPESSPTG